MSLAGKKVVLTGTFSAFERAEAQARLEAMGVDVTGSVSRNTHVVFAGERGGSKLARAAELGVPVYGEAELLATLASGQLPGGPTVEPKNPRAPRPEVEEPVARADSNPWVVGKRFVITGEIPGLGRTEAADAVAALGGKVTGSVSSKTTFLVVGTNPGQNKLDDAESHGVPTMDAEQFLRILAGESPDDEG